MFTWEEGQCILVCGVLTHRGAQAFHRPIPANQKLATANLVRGGVDDGALESSV